VQSKSFPASRILSLFVCLAFTSAAFAANLKVVPTTTLSAETGNNTAAPNGISAATNGGAAYGNISKLPIKSLLYPGASPKIYASLMGWWGKSGHISIGENSQDPAVVKAQVEDMQSRGIDGAIFAWYGKGSYHDLASQQLMKQAEAHAGFQFIIMIDQGTLQWYSSGMTPTQAMIYHMTYLSQEYYNSPAYAKVNGRPIVLEFGTEAYSIDWPTVLASVPGNPVMIFRNPPAFTNTNAYGGYGWGPAGGLAYTDYFNKIAGQNPSKMVIADAWKGFNDVLASWSLNRVTDYSCGQTWLNSMAELGKYYSATKPLLYLQVPTWNDYEEGTSIESGINNCVTVNAAVSGASLQWTLGGAGLENTIDHYTAFVSTDGQNLMPLTDVPVGTHSLDLSQYNLAGGTYTLYVKAVAKASMTNQMSNAATMTINLPPTAGLSVTPASAPTGTAVTASTAASSDADGTIASSQIDFGDGTVMAGPVATHAYARSGSYTVTATVTDNMGATASAVQVVAATNRAPVAALSLTPASAPTGTTISASTAASSDPDGNIASSVINFGDGTSASGAAAAHAYAAPGTYTVTATVTDNMGAISSTTQTVTVTNRAPNVVLGVTPGSGYTGVQVTATTVGSADPDGTIASTVIDFGDGQLSSSATHTHQYSTAGTFTVKATVTDNLGAVSTATSVVTIAPSAVVITLPTTAANAATPLNVKAVANSGRTIIAMTVYVDNVKTYSTTASQLNINVSLKAGTHTLMVKADDNTGRTLSSTATVSVAAGGIAPRGSRTATVSNAADSTTAARLQGSASSTPTTEVSASLPRASRLGR
jgi:PKD repeat protein